jgi:hypothetical protein
MCPAGARMGAGFVYALCIPILHTRVAYNLSCKTPIAATKGRPYRALALLAFGPYYTNAANLKHRN